MIGDNFLILRLSAEDEAVCGFDIIYTDHATSRATDIEHRTMVEGTGTTEFYTATSLGSGGAQAGAAKEPSCAPPRYQRTLFGSKIVDETARDLSHPRTCRPS